MIALAAQAATPLLELATLDIGAAMVRTVNAIRAKAAVAAAVPDQATTAVVGPIRFGTINPVMAVLEAVDTRVEEASGLGLVTCRVAADITAAGEAAICLTRQDTEAGRRVSSTYGGEFKTMGKRFTAVHDFHSEEFLCDYVGGMSYEARDQDKKLLDLLPQWIAEGKVVEGGPEAIVSGSDKQEKQNGRNAPRANPKRNR